MSKAPFMIRALQAVKAINFKDIPNATNNPLHWFFLNKPKNCFSNLKVQQKYLELRKFTVDNFIHFL